MTAYSERMPHVNDESFPVTSEALREFYADISAPDGYMTNSYDARLRQQRYRETAFGARLSRAQRILARTAFYTTVSTSAAIGLYAQDVAAGYEILKDTHPVVRSIDESVDRTNNHRMILGINGLGTTSAANVMESLPYETMGIEAALDYDKKGIDTTIIKDEVKKFAQQHNVESIVFSGHSMGGDVALEVASLLHVDPDAPEVTDIILDCTPPNLSAVQDHRREAGDTMLTAIRDIPGHRNSRFLRGVGEMTSRYRTYVTPGEGARITGGMIDIRAFAAESMHVKREKLPPKAGSLGLFEDQYRQIVADGAKHSFARLSEKVGDKRLPRIHYLMPLDSESDDTVKVDTAARIFRELGSTYKIPVLTYRLPQGTGHANPAQAPDQYGSVLRDQIIPLIERADERHARRDKTTDVQVVSEAQAGRGDK